MRLIDADALIERLNDLYEWCQDERKSGLEQSMCIVQEQSTAYDVDKVVEKIECRRRFYRDTDDFKVRVGLDCAIDIVRRGGVDENLYTNNHRI